MATKKKKQPQSSEHNISIRPRKENIDLKKKLTALATKERRSLNEYAVKILENQIDNPKKVF
mgnify:CR=1 FL=1